MLPTCLMLAALAPAAPADEPPSLRELCIRAPLVVLARPVDPADPTRFTVAAVLRGKGAKAGDDLRPLGLVEKQMRTFDEVDRDTKKPKPRNVSLALLFLEPARTTGEFSPYRVMPAGFRLCTDDDRVLVPPDPGEAGADQPHEVEPLDLRGDPQRSRADLSAVDRLQAARRVVRPQQRVRALTDWVERRRSEFAQNQAATPSDLSPSGWYELGRQVFEWIFEDASVEEAWAAVRLYASLNRGDIPRLKAPLFASEEGRKLLLNVALDERQLSGDRQRALQLLCSPGTVEKVEEKERAALVDRLRSSLNVKDEEMQRMICRTLVRLKGGEDGKPARLDGKLVSALISSYRAAQPGAARDDLAWALCRLAPPEQYRELTTNPAGVCVRLAEFSHDGAEINFFLDLQTGGARVYEPPTLVIEKMGNLGFVAETKRVPLTVLHLPAPWREGLGDTTLAVRLELSKLITIPPPTRGKVVATPYRLRVEGTIGKDKDRRTWRSEPKRISVLPMLPGGGIYSTDLGR